MTVLQTDLATVLRRLHAGVREALADLSTGRAREIHGTNPKGDRQQAFDLAAAAAVRRILEGELDSGIILSEESHEHHFGAITWSSASGASAPSTATATDDSGRHRDQLSEPSTGSMTKR